MLEDELDKVILNLKALNTPAYGKIELVYKNRSLSGVNVTNSFKKV